MEAPARPAFFPAAATSCVLLLVMCGVSLGGFDLKRWPLGAIETLNQQPATARLFHEQDWGGLIAAECRPERRSYLDDRFELFGKEAILEYVDVLSGGPLGTLFANATALRWSGCALIEGWRKRLLLDRDWNVVYRDKVSILLRHGADSAPCAGDGNGSRLARFNGIIFWLWRIGVQERACSSGDFSRSGAFPHRPRSARWPAASSTCCSLRPSPQTGHRLFASIPAATGS